MKYVVTVFVLLLNINLHSQIKIGQPVNEALYFLNHLKKMKGWYVEKEYINGKIKEIVIYKQKQIYYDLDIVTDEIERMIIDNNDRYVYSLRQYPKLSLKYITAKFNSIYKEYKIENLYFSKDYKYVMTLALIDNYATVKHEEVNSKRLSESVKKVLKIKIAKFKKEKLQNDLKEKQLDSLKNTFANIDDYRKGYSKVLKEKLIKEAIDVLQYEEFDFDRNVSKSIKGKYNIRLYAKESTNYATVRMIKLNETDFFPSYLQSNLSVEIPKIKKEIDNEEVYLNREINIAITYDVIVGKVLIKNRNNKIKFLSVQKLTEVQKDTIESYFKNKKKGNYLIYYQFGLINEKDATIVIEDGRIK